MSVPRVRRGPGRPPVRRWSWRPAVAGALVVAGSVAITTLLPAAAGAAPAGPGVAPAALDIAAASLATDRGISPTEARIRMGWQTAAPDLDEKLAGQVGYGGMWIDTADGDRVKVGMVPAADRAGVTAAVRSAGLAAAVDIVPVRWTAAQLATANGWLATELARANPGAKGGLTAALRPERNAVELLTPAASPLTAAQQAVVTAAKTRFGAMLLTGTYAGTPTTRACSYPYCDAPLRAGIAITYGGTPLCTGSFLARSRSDNKLYQFTAGHCALGNRTGTWATKFANGQPHPIGTIGGRWQASGSDEAIIQVANPAGWAARAWVNVTASSYTAADPQYAIGADGGSVVGMRICTTGAFYGKSDCGNVQKLGVTVTYSDTGLTVRGLGEGNFCGVGGDSGAPMYANHIAYGLQTGGAALCDSYFQGIRGAENALGVDVAVGS